MGDRRAAARARLGLVGLLTLVGLSGSAWAQVSDAPLDVELRLRGSGVAASFDVTTAFTEDFRQRFLGGITSRARIRTLFVSLEGDELGRIERRCEMRFDVWDEVVLVRVIDGDDEVRRVVRLVDRALRACGRIDDIPMLPVAVLAGERFRVLAEVVLNPVSEELLEKTREFMSNPSGTSSGRVSFFGAIARFFRSTRSAQGESFLFRSELLSLPEAP